MLFNFFNFYPTFNFYKIRNDHALLCYRMNPTKDIFIDITLNTRYDLRSKMILRLLSDQLHYRKNLKSTIYTHFRFLLSIKTILRRQCEEITGINQRPELR